MADKDDMRAAFEEWADLEHYFMERDSQGRYCYVETEQAWYVWRACARSKAGEST